MNATTKLTLCVISIASLSTIVACTVTSNTDGNTNPTVFVPNEDSGSSTLVCPPAGQLTTIGANTLPNCQACLNTNCCEQLHKCYDVPGSDSGTNSDCETYSLCIDGCNDQTDAELQKACFDACDTSAAPGVVTGYNAVQACAGRSCSSAALCNVSPDAGH